MLHWTVDQWVVWGHEWLRDRWSAPRLIHAKEFELEDDPV